MVNLTMENIVKEFARLVRARKRKSKSKAQLRNSVPKAKRVKKKQIPSNSKTSNFGKRKDEDVYVPKKRVKLERS